MNEQGKKVYDKCVRYNYDSKKQRPANANAFVHGKYSVTNDGKKLNARMWETTSGKQLQRAKQEEKTEGKRSERLHVLYAKQNRI